MGFTRRMAALRGFLRLPDDACGCLVGWTACTRPQKQAVLGASQRNPNRNESAHLNFDMLYIIAPATPLVSARPNAGRPASCDNVTENIIVLSHIHTSKQLSCCTTPYSAPGSPKSPSRSPHSPYRSAHQEPDNFCDWLAILVAGRHLQPLQRQLERRIDRAKVISTTARHRRAALRKKTNACGVTRSPRCSRRRRPSTK